LGASLGYGWVNETLPIFECDTSLLTMRNLTALLWQKLVIWDHLRIDPAAEDLAKLLAYCVT